MDDICSKSHTVQLTHVTDGRHPLPAAASTAEANQSTEPAKKKQRKSSMLETLLSQMQQSDEKRISAINEMKEAIIASNKERIDAIKELNDTMKQMLQKL